MSIILLSAASAQAPSLISYQAVLRDNTGQPIPDTDVKIDLSILQGSTSGAVVFTETHSAHTNSFGLVNLQVGSIGTGIGLIDWTDGPYFLKVEADEVEFGTIQLISVPYALYAQKAGNVFSGVYGDLSGKPDLSIYLESETDPVFSASPAQTITTEDISEWNSPKWVRESDSLYYIEGNVGIGTKDPRSTLSVRGTTPNDSAIFEVKNNNGLTVFAVYNNGVRINLDETSKASKGGFAIGGYGSVKENVFTDYLNISGDSIRMYINNTSPQTKGVKGGFAIGGFGATKSPGGTRYLNIAGNEGTNLGFNTFLGYKAGGPGSGGISNVAIGYYAGYSLNLASSLSGRNNIFIGDSAGLINNSGYQNVYIGKNAGASASAGYHNVYIGYRTGSKGHGQYNTMVGNQAGEKNAGGYGNVFFGDRAGQGITTGDRNVLIGTQAGWKLGDGNDNVYLGNATGFDAIDIERNIFVGNNAGSNLITGNNNVIIGHDAGLLTLEGSGNIFIGREAGKQVGNVDSRLIIDNTYRTTIDQHYITGDITGYKLRFNTNVGIWTNPDPAFSLTVQGNVKANGYDSSSDIRLKEEIETIKDPLQKVLLMRGVTFNWKNDPAGDKSRHIGFVAQEIADVVPEIVNTEGEYYSVEYSPVVAILVEAIKELKKENDELRKEIDNLEDFESRIEALESLLPLKK